MDEQMILYPMNATHHNILFIQGVMNVKPDVKLGGTISFAFRLAFGA